MKKYFVVLTVLFMGVLVQAQVNFEGWRVHLPYYKNASVTVAGTKVYCGSNSGLFTYDVEDGSIERLSRISGLSDVEVKIIKHNVAKNISVVIYQNTNIDLIDHSSNRIYNVPDVFMKSIIGAKSINHVCFFENKAYLACSFGIVVLDLDKKQIVESYQNLGLGGSQLAFLSISIFQNQIFASAQNAVYTASLSAPNLSDFNFWVRTKTSTNSGKS
ncbi:MAG: hypothetical protein Q8R57_00280, partial [Bacteroidota bacterium]|nr:hypothetical protein [Bacteroidota bacterium]